MEEVTKSIIGPATGSLAVLIVFLTLVLPMILDNVAAINDNNIELERLNGLISNMDRDFDDIDKSFSKIDDKLDMLHLAICDLSDGTHC